MSMCSSPGEDCSKHQKLRGSLHQREQHSQSIVKLFVFRFAKALALLYSVLMDCMTRAASACSGSLVRSNSRMAALYNSCHVGSGIAASLLDARKARWNSGCCVSAIITLARSCMSISERSTRDCGSPFHELIALRLTFVSIRPNIPACGYPVPICRPDHFALPRHRETRWRRYGSRL
jgi:hypothetical protein